MENESNTKGQNKGAEYVPATASDLLKSIWSDFTPSPSTLKPIYSDFTPSPSTAVTTETSSTSSDMPKPYQYLKEHLDLLDQSFKEREQVWNKQFEHLVNETKAEIEKNRIRVIEAIGIFVALITFISTNITIFSHITSLSAALYFMITMSIVILLFLSAFLIFVNKPTLSPIKFFGLLLIPLAFLLILVGLFFLTRKYTSLNFTLNLKEEKVPYPKSITADPISFSKPETENLSSPHD